VVAGSAALLSNACAHAISSACSHTAPEPAPEPVTTATWPNTTAIAIAATDTTIAATDTAITTDAVTATATHSGDSAQQQQRLIRMLHDWHRVAA
jgi:hypothetical protein